MMRPIMGLTSPKVSNKTTTKTTNGDEDIPSTLIESSTGFQTTEISVNVALGNEQLHERGS